MSTKLYTYQEAADYLGMSPKYVRKLCDEHKIGYIVKTRLRGYGRCIRRQRWIPQNELFLFAVQQAAWKYVPRREYRQVFDSFKAQGTQATAA